MINATIFKFGYPETLVADYTHWLVLLRPAQPTLGSLVLAAKSEALAFGALDPAVYAELGAIAADIERVLCAFTRYQRLNYLMLMMVDPHVHFHVIPRYEGARTWQGADFADAGWPKPPALADAITLDEAQRDQLVAELKQLW